MKAQDDAFKARYWKMREEQGRPLTDADRAAFRELGYTDEQIAEIEGTR